MALNARLGLAKAEAELGRTQQALEDLLTLSPQDQDGEIHYRIARLYRKLGDNARAREALAIFKRLRADSLRASDADLSGVEDEGSGTAPANLPNRP